MTRRHVLLLLPVLLLLVLPSVHAWAYGGWQYRVPITVNNSNSTALTDFQVKITVDTASLIAAGKMNADCSDMRFADSSDNPLPYWIESGCNTASTVVWVKVPSIPANGSTTIYMYYGNPAAASESNGFAVFDFFDDFDKDTTSQYTCYGTCTWNSAGYVTVQATYEYSAGAYWGIMKRDIGRNADIVLRASVRPHGLSTVQNSDVLVLIRESDSSGSAPQYGHGAALRNGYAGEVWLVDQWVAWVESAQYQWSDNAWAVLEVRGGATTKAQACGGDSCTSVHTVSQRTCNDIAVTIRGQNTAVDVDWIAVRKYAPSDPTATFGAEEALSGLAITLTHSPTAQSDLALDPENNVTSITVDYNAVITKTNMTVTYWRAYDGDTNATIAEGNADVNYITFSRTYTAVGNYNTCVYVRAVDDANNTYEDTACDTVHIDEYPQNLSITWDMNGLKIPFPDENITFNGSATDNGTLTYSWDFGDGNAASGQTVSHAYGSAGTYTVTLTVKDDVGLSKSTSVSVPVYSVPELNWTPATPHVQEPTTFQIIHDSRLSVVDTNWQVTDATVDAETNTTLTTRFQHYGTHSVSVAFVLTDGTNTREWNVGGDVNVLPITFGVKLFDEETLKDLNVQHFDNKQVKIDLYLRDTKYLFKYINTVGGIAYWNDLNQFPDHLITTYFVSGVPVRRVIYLREDKYDQNINVAMPDATTTQVLQEVFYITDQTGQFSDPIFIIRRHSNAETFEVLSDKKDAEGKVVAYLVSGAEYTLAVWQNGVEKSLGTFIPVTSTTINLTIGGFVLTPKVPAIAGLTLTQSIVKDENTLLISFTSEQPVTIDFTVYSQDGNLVYASTLGPDVRGEATVVGIDPAIDYHVVYTVHLPDGSTVQIERWVSATRKVVLGWPDTWYKLFASMVILAALLGGGAVFSWVGGLLAVFFAGLFTYWGWISVSWAVLAVLAGAIILGRWQS